MVFMSLLSQLLTLRFVVVVVVVFVSVTVCLLSSSCY